MERVERMRLVVPVVLVLVVAWTLLINGAVPWLGVPTQGQAASMLGYAEAFASQHWYSLHAGAFGYPVPTSLATGLPLARLAGWFLLLGLSAPDAYSASVASWLVAGVLGAWALGDALGLRSWLAALAAAAWMSSPMVWWHQGYSSLALGMAMLPLYVWTAMRVLDTQVALHWPWLPRSLVVALVFVLTCSIALFMDGYTFMMFAVATGCLWLAKATRSLTRRRALAFALPVYLIGFGSAYLLYTRFVGRSAFEPAPLDFFRSYGLDLSFLAVPTRGQLWLWDLLGLSTLRSDTVYFGDASVWLATFALPLTLLGFACVLLRRSDRSAWVWLSIAVVGLYMSLGPTLKVDAVKPPGNADPLMRAASGIAPTGSAYLSEHLPGLRSMRAAYRWEALFLLGMWGLVALQASRSRRDREGVWAALYVALIVSSAPHLASQWQDYRAFRNAFIDIDEQLAGSLAQRIPVGSRVLFVPYGNDVMANYLAPQLKAVTYNVGGDKQLEIVKPSWPATVSRLAMNRFEAGDAVTVRDVLVARDADVIIIPYFSTLWAAHMWPCPALAKGYSEGMQALVASRNDFPCPEQARAAYAPVLAQVRRDPRMEIDEQPLYALVRLRTVP